MADDKNKDLDPDEDNNEPFEDDDFGLPDLEYDELEDDDEFEDEFDSPAFDDDETAEEEISEEVTAEEEEALSVEDDFTSEEEEMVEEESFEDEMDDFSVEDAGDEEGFDISDEDLQKELEELEAEGMDFDAAAEGEDAGFYEQETYEDFSDENVLDSVFGADEEIETPAGFEDKLISGSKSKGPSIDNSAKQRAASQYASSYSDSKSEKGNFARIVVIGAIVILAIAVTLWQTGIIFNSDAPKEVAKKEQVKKPVEQPKPADPEPKKEEPKKEEPKIQKPVATRTTPGVVNSLEQRTGKAYVIVASFVDGDLAMDHANKLAASGKSPYLIPPFNNGLYYRVAIAEFNTFDDATQNLANYKEEFGADVWTLRY